MINYDFKQHEESALNLVKTDWSLRTLGKLEFACQWGFLTVVQYLINPDNGFGINPSGNHKSALYCAAKNDHLDVVKYLMGLDKSHGISPLTTDMGYNTYDIAFQEGATDSVEYLLSLHEFSDELTDKDCLQKFEGSLRRQNLDTAFVLLSYIKNYADRFGEYVNEDYLKLLVGFEPKIDDFAKHRSSHTPLTLKRRFERYCHFVNLIDDIIDSNEVTGELKEGLLRFKESLKKVTIEAYPIVKNNSSLVTFIWDVKHASRVNAIFSEREIDEIEFRIKRACKAQISN